MAALVFVGFMGAGKSSAAREAAAALGTRAQDSDRVLEQRLGTTIEAFFDAHGEARFREEEENVCVELLERARDGDVLSLGGGALGSERTRAALAPHTIVLAEIDEATAWRRATGRGRPLARDREAFSALFARRASVYEGVADAYLPPGERTRVRRAAPVLRARPDGTRIVWATSAGGEYPVLVGPGALAVDPWPAPGRRFVVTDEHVADLYGGRVSPSALIEIPPGEEHKTLATVERVTRALAASDATRGDHVVALGGGVVGDLAGFCAATFLRGVPVVGVPTTLVAQVDSAYGGKTGVDLPEGKNHVGAYHQPAAVLVDVATLATLPEAELAAGRAEVVKTALIAGGALWDDVRRGRFEDPDTVLACARLKLSVVASDERDGGRRQVLNLGHTVGHALETATGYARLRHGEAVALGLMAALRLSGRDALRDEVGELLTGAGLSTSLPGFDVDAVVTAVARDKKRTGADVPFVLVHAPGDVRHGERVEPDALRAAVAELAA